MRAKLGTIVAIIQARMSATRLPGKVMADVSGRPMLWHVMNRVKQARKVEKLVLATTTEKADDPVAEFCAATDITCYRGSEMDVLDRFYKAAKENLGHTVVRITSDCPLIDPDVIDRVVTEFQESGSDYAANCIRYTYPDGLDVEVFSFEALEKAWREAKKPNEREHVTPYIRFSNKFTVFSVEHNEDLTEYRWTVDESADLEFVRKVYAYFAPRTDFRLNDILKLLREKPELSVINAGIVMNEGYYVNIYQYAKAGRATKLDVSKSEQYFKRAEKVIPGCTQTFSKGYTQHIKGISPLFLERGKGCRVCDVDGNEYIDYIQGLLPNILGYASDEVNQAVSEQIALGHSFSLPHRLEVELSERLVELIPCAEMVRFGKNGSDATSGAIRAARAFTGRDRIACCGYHGWQDWYIGSTQRNLGVPESVRSLTHPFHYNDLSALHKLLEKYSGEFAAVIMEPVNFFEPKSGYLEGVKELTHKNGALLIFDEICVGFHLGLGGAQKKFGVVPDLACFGKAMGNGFPISCIVGRRDVMKCFEEIFYSFTFAGEVASMAAAVKVLDILEHSNALMQIEANGRRLQDGFNVMARKAGLSDRLKCIGYPAWNLVQFLDEEGKDNLLLRTLFQQEVTKRGVLIISTHNLTAAHDENTVERTLEVYACVLKTLVGWLSDKDLSKYLEGPVIQPIFRAR
ncbi:MAG: aminotransferase class III-fold pyridoxal phosphate-dependent enzyme [Desulfobacterales bacterium]|nr:aminotransferase class III-fold pyridoxal phosphate-dependent enzyme [Desulfobacterales bacterium]